VESNTFQPGLRDSYRKEVRDAYGIGDDVVVILFVGSEFKRKGLRFLIEGVAQLIHEIKGEKELRCLIDSRDKR
jgi:UDP-glucose:(heptosyl)LPS alpha-1,3-glucosyltransferase